MFSFVSAYWRDRFLCFLTALCAATAPLGASEPEDSVAQIEELLGAGRYNAALEQAEQFAAEVQESGRRKGLNVASAMVILGRAQHKMARYAEADLAYRLAISIREKRLGPTHLHVADALIHLVRLSNDLGRHHEARALADRALTIRMSRLGPQNLKTVQATYLAAITIAHLHDYESARKRFQLVLEIRNRMLEPGHPARAEVMHRLGRTYGALAKFDKAEVFLKRSLAIQEKRLRPDHPTLIKHLRDLATWHERKGDIERGVHLQRRATSIAEKTWGENALPVGYQLHRSAQLALAQGDPKRAERLTRRAIKIVKGHPGPKPPGLGAMVSFLAVSLTEQQRANEAEPFFKQAVTIAENTRDANAEGISASLLNLGRFYNLQGRYNEAETLLRRSLSVAESVLGSEHPFIAVILLELAGAQSGPHPKEKARALLKRAVRLREKAFGPNHPGVARALVRAAQTENPEDAESHLLRALDILERAFGQQHSGLVWLLSDLAEINVKLGRANEALSYAQRGLKIADASFNDFHPGRLRILQQIARLQSRKKNWREADKYLAEAVKSAIARTSKRWKHTAKSFSDRNRERLPIHGAAIVSRIKIRSLMAATDETIARGFTNEGFEHAQWANASAAASALARMSSRFAVDDDTLGGAIRERQDLVAEWRSRDKRRTRFLAQPVADRNHKANEANEERLRAIDQRMSEIDKRLAGDFPQYAELVNPKPVRVDQIQAQLLPNEVLLFLVDTPSLDEIPDASFIWVLTPNKAYYVKTSLGGHSLRNEVLALRCGLNRAAWYGTRAQRCSELLGIPLANAPAGSDSLPFDLQRAQFVYNELFGQIAEVIRGKQLLIVPTGAFNGLPMQVLVTQFVPPAQKPNYSKVMWFGQQNALTILPTVTSFNALRVFAKSSKALAPFVGFGNPLLKGVNGADDSAWKHQSCAQVSKRALEFAGTPRAPRVSIDKLFRGELADVATLVRQPPLPETAQELCEVARSAGSVDVNDVVYLGERATEAQLKQLSASGTLAQARIVHFATHGLLARETSSLSQVLAEPALLLTPPKQASQQDDGLLTTSEIARLKLDADWVILSACNTAAGDHGSGQAFSGLARAFFYAGARALLVSHWYVDSQATVQLITGAFRTIRNYPRISRAEAMRRAMTAMIEAGGRTSHPSYWAPFVVVGAGALPVGK